jgi:hypothetical protein
VAGRAKRGRFVLGWKGVPPDGGVRLPDQARPTAALHQGDSSYRDLAKRIPTVKIPKTSFSANVLLLGSIMTEVSANTFL